MHGKAQLLQYDAICTFVFPDYLALAKFLYDKEGAALNSDHENFMDDSQMKMMVGDEYMLVDNGEKVNCILSKSKEDRESSRGIIQVCNLRANAKGCCVCLIFSSSASASTSTSRAAGRIRLRTTIPHMSFLPTFIAFHVAHIASGGSTSS